MNIAPLEVWRPIIDVPGIDVSNFGRIRSEPREYTRSHPRNPSMKQTRKVPGKLLTPNKTSNGYLMLNCRRGRKLIHRAVVEAFGFEGPIPPGLIVCHIDGNRCNNNISNLYAGTYVDNLNDAKRHGTYCKRPSAKITQHTADEIRASSDSRRSLAKKYGVCVRTIGLIKNNITWVS